MADLSDEPGVHDRRNAPRYPVFGECEIRGAGTRVHGHCIDISETGISIAADKWDGHRFTLRLKFHLGSLNVRCETVRVEPIRATVIVHARFEAMDSSCKELLGSVIAEAQENFEEAQRFLIAGTRRKSA